MFASVSRFVILGIEYEDHIGPSHVETRARKGETSFDHGLLNANDKATMAM